MPAVEILYWQDLSGRTPVVEWLEDLGRKDRRGLVKCAERIERLAEFGHELRRPVADIPRDEIHELRAKHGKVQYRLLYFFHARNAVVLAHAIIKKESRVASADIDLAVQRKEAFRLAPEAHTYQEEIENESSEHDA